METIHHTPVGDEDGTISHMQWSQRRLTGHKRILDVAEEINEPENSD